MSNIIKIVLEDRNLLDLNRTKNLLGVVYVRLFISYARFVGFMRSS